MSLNKNNYIHEESVPDFAGGKQIDNAPQEMDVDYSSDNRDENTQAVEDYDDAPQAPEDHTVVKAWEKMNSDGTMRKHLRARKSAFIHNLLHLNGAPFSFEGRGYLIPIYDRNDENILLKTARQVEKTTFLGNNLTIDSAVIPYNKSLYVSPSHTQTRQFSNEKLKPSIEQSPLIRKYLQDSSVSMQVFEKGFTNGSYIFLRSAFRTADRCVRKGSIITMGNGSMVPVEKVQKGDMVLSFCRDTAKVTYRKVLGIQSNGFNKLWSLSLTSGHSIESNSIHRYVTDTGIKNVCNITDEDCIPIPFNFLPKRDGYDEKFIILGLLLGDGSISFHSDSSEKTKIYNTRFFNDDKSLIDYSENIFRKYGLFSSLSSKPKPGETKERHTVYLKSKKVANLFEKYNVMGTDEFTKFIPTQIFSNRVAIRSVLRGLFESDGWCCLNNKNRQSEVGFVSGSKELSRGVHYGLQALGIYSQLVTQEPKGRQKSTCYVVKIRNISEILKFSKEVGFICKQEKLNKIIHTLGGYKESSARGYCNDVPARYDCSRSLKDAKISTHALWKKHGISFRDNKNTNKIIARHKVEQIYNITKDNRLLKWLNDDVRWVSVKSSNCLCVKDETFDLSIDTDEVFCANGMFTHNTRGISARNLNIDEVQDMVGSEIPVIMECTSHFDDARILMAGTPKSFDNPIENYWMESTQNEWLVHCPCCGHWNFLDEKSIAPTDWYVSGKLPPGPVCSKCEKPIDVRRGQWMSLSPTKRIIGYRIPQLMVPWIITTYDQWLKLLWKRDNYPFGQFANEVLGLSYDNASKPISRGELISWCNEYELYSDNPTPAQIREIRRHICCLGVDWGEGNDGMEKSPSGKIRTASYTVVTIGTYINQTQFKLLYTKKYIGKEVDPDFVVKDIARLCRVFNIRLVGADFGHGWGVNNHLIRLISAKKLVQFQYLSKQKERMKWDPIGVKYQLLRNLIISEMFFSLKKGYVQFPKWSQIEPYCKDIEAVYTEYSEFTREMKYDHKQANPDDFLHSLIYCKLASDICIGKIPRV